MTSDILQFGKELDEYNEKVIRDSKEKGTYESISEEEGLTIEKTFMKALEIMNKVDVDMIDEQVLKNYQHAYFSILNAHLTSRFPLNSHLRELLVGASKTLFEVARSANKLIQ